MKRLLWYLNQITDTETTTFRYTVMLDRSPVQKEIYDGECIVTYLKPGGEMASERPGVRREPTYWRNDIAYTFDRTNRMALDRPTITIAIPVERLGITEYTVAGADFCLRKIATYFELVNKEYENKARPDSDNGKFYVYAPGGEVLVRNTAYFSMRPVKDYENGSGAGIFVTKFIDPPLDRMCLCIRIEAQLPHGNLKRMRKMLVGNLPDETERFVREFDRDGFRSAIELEKKQKAIRKFLCEENYCAFIANGSILAREKGTELPMKDALPFQSTSE
ncbi:MAG TPA: P-loop domain-containing protein, partial [Lachnospiraceae bacterium]|nr:P-loop domain-containing protein [Lachnospiraceae bacterium]